KPAAIAPRDVARGVEGTILPSAVGITRAQDALGILKLLGHLHECERRAGTGVKALPVGLSLRDLPLAELVGLIDQAGVADSDRAVPIIWHAIVAEAVDVIGIEPVVVDSEKIIAPELTIVVGALAEVAEEVLRKRSHEGILAVLQPRVGVVIGEIHARVAVDHIDDDGDAVLVANVNKRVEVRALAEAFVHSEIADRQITPIDGASDVRQWHDLDCVDAEILQIGDNAAHALEIAAELGNVDLVEHQVRECWRAPLRFGGAPNVRLVAERKGRELADPELAGKRIDDPVERADIGVANRVAVDVA